jgi:hypothetical protein
MVNCFGTYVLRYGDHKANPINIALRTGARDREEELGDGARFLGLKALNYGK